jgi:hypothetical protein
MKTGFVFRHGRRVRISDEQKACENACLSYCLPILCLCGTTFLVYQLYSKEAYFVAQQGAFAEVENEVQMLPDAGASTLREHISSSGKNIMHFTGNYSATVGDSAFNLRFDHALKIQRKTEYCQWMEHSHDDCQTCKRRGNDGKEETYSCNCVRQYTYVKMWRDHLVPSFGFDQPANHHNPMRDPFPSTAIFSGDAKVGAIQILPGITENLRAHLDPLTFSPGGRPFKPGFLTRMWHEIFGEPATRFEEMERLRPFYESNAFNEHHFVYTNTWEGWFFSAYEMPTWQRVVRGFGQWLEGSLLDWQIGDLYDMANGCTPGDLRIRYYIADPEEISVVGQIQKTATEVYRAVPYRTSKDFPVGIMHAGQHSADDLFAAETLLAKSECRWARFLNLLSGMGAIYLIVYFGLWDPSSWPACIGASVGISLIFMSLVWVAAYGLSDWSGGDSDIWTVIVGSCGAILTSASMRQKPAKSVYEKEEKEE